MRRRAAPPPAAAAAAASGRCSCSSLRRAPLRRHLLAPLPGRPRRARRGHRRHIHRHRHRHRVVPPPPPRARRRRRLGDRHPGAQRDAAAPRRGRPSVPLRGRLLREAFLPAPRRRPRLAAVLTFAAAVPAFVALSGAEPVARGCPRAALRPRAGVARHGGGLAAAGRRERRGAVRRRGAGRRGRGRGRGGEDPPFQPAPPWGLERPAGDRAEHPIPRPVGTRAPVRGLAVAPRRGDWYVCLIDFSPSIICAVISITYVLSKYRYHIFIS